MGDGRRCTYLTPVDALMISQCGYRIDNQWHEYMKYNEYILVKYGSSQDHVSRRTLEGSLWLPSIRKQRRERATPFSTSCRKARE